MATEYDRIREANIASNRALLLSLKLNAPMFAPPAPKPKASRPVKARPSLAASVSPSEESVTTLDSSNNNSNRRRSSRLQKADPDAAYKAEDSEDSMTADEAAEEEEVKKAPRKRSAPKTGGSSYNAAAAAAKRRKNNLPGGAARKVKGLSYSGRPDPQVFGHQIGTEVGDWWAMRMECSQAGVHGPPVSGISGRETEGCFSVALSGGYEDDVDLGYAFTYTGSGGRDLSGTKSAPKNLRTAPQTFDQVFTRENRALQVSVETGEPVRVIRGFKNHSCFAPEEGYRYDGLYKVEKAWREKGQAGFLVCKFAFVRLPNQPKIPVKSDRSAEAEDLYRAMGFDVAALPASPVKTKWSRKLAKDRVEAKNEEDEEGSVKEEEEEVKDEEVKDEEVKDEDGAAKDEDEKVEAARDE